MLYPATMSNRSFGAYVGTLLLSCGVAACGGTAAPAETSKSMTTSQAATPLPTTLTVEQADRIVNEARAALARPDAQNPLRTPKSLDDVLAILRSDQIDLFDAGVTFAAKDGSPKAKALQAQTEIAWGENQRIVAQILDSLSSELREEVLELRELEAAGKLDAAENERVQRLETLLASQTALVPALSKLAPTHLAKGRVLAESLVNEAPADYEGYRVLADYARIRGDWEKFDALVKEVQTRHPNSTGIMFLQGIELAERSRDFKGASESMRQALAKEPRFARAQVQLFLFADGIDAKVTEFEKLKAISPQHQIVVLVGPLLSEAKSTRDARRKRLRQTDWRIQRFL